MSIINFSNTRQMEGLFDAINPIKELIESKSIFPERLIGRNV